jgi:hypothetical protein
MEEHGTLELARIGIAATVLRLLSDPAAAGQPLTVSQIAASLPDPDIIMAAWIAMGVLIDRELVVNEGAGLPPQPFLPSR